jgi:hypothetical protein
MQDGRIITHADVRRLLISQAFSRYDKGHIIPPFPAVE